MNILATSCDFRFFESCKTLISSCLHFFKELDIIYVYDLGMSTDQVNFLKTIKKVNIKHYNKEFIEKYPHFVVPKTFAWKTYILKELSETAGHNLFYIDSGACFVNHANSIINILDNTEIVLVGDTHPNKSFIHEKCLNIMNASEAEINGTQIWAGFQAYKTGGRFQNIITEAFEYAKIKECIEGSTDNHRHDQSIFSILSIRYSVPRQNINVLGEYRGPNISPEQIIYAHRNTYFNETYLEYENK